MPDSVISAGRGDPSSAPTFQHCGEAASPPKPPATSASLPLLPWIAATARACSSPTSEVEKGDLFTPDSAVTKGSFFLRLPFNNQQASVVRLRLVSLTWGSYSRTAVYCLNKAICANQATVISRIFNSAFPKMVGF